MGRSTVFSSKSWVKVILTLFILGVIVAVLVYIFIYNKPQPNYEKKIPQYVLNAQELYHSFADNKINAEKKFNGQVIEVKGELNKIEVNDSLVVAVFVFNQGLFGDEGIRCTFLPKYYEAGSILKSGEEVSIKGFCTGYNETDVILIHCSIIGNKH
jgi:hypothetical protein